MNWNNMDSKPPKNGYYACLIKKNIGCAPDAFILYYEKECDAFYIPESSIIRISMRGMTLTTPSILGWCNIPKIPA